MEPHELHDQNQEPALAPSVNPEPIAFVPQVISAAAPNPGQVNVPVEPVSTPQISTLPPTLVQSVPNDSGGVNEAHDIKPKRDKRILVSIIVAVLLFGSNMAGAVYIFIHNFQSTQRNSAVTTTATQYVDGKYGFGLTIPAGWQRLSATGSRVSFQSAASEMTNSTYHDSVSVSEVTLKSDSAQNSSLSQAVAAATTRNESAARYAFHSSTDIMIGKNAVPATLVVYESGNQTVASLFLISNNTLYNVNGIGLSAGWTQNEAVIKNAVLSFEP
jgi:hypothetical protein